MKRSLTVGLYAGFMAYCVLSLLYGPSGSGALADLRGQTAEMSKNIRLLEQRAQELGRRLDSVRNDPETLRVEARSLGFVGPGEGLIHIVPALDRGTHTRFSSLVGIVEPRSLSDADIKRVAAGVCILACVLVRFAARAKRL